MDKPLRKTVDEECYIISRISVDVLIKTIANILGHIPTTEDLSNFVITLSQGMYAEQGPPALFRVRPQTDEEYNRDLDLYKFQLENFGNSDLKNELEY